MDHSILMDIKGIQVKSVWETLYVDELKVVWFLDLSGVSIGDISDKRLG